MLSSPSPSPSGKMVSAVSPFSGLRSVACLVLTMGFLAGVMAFDNSRKDNVSVPYHFASTFVTETLRCASQLAV